MSDKKIVTSRAKNILPSYTVEMSSIARALQREGKDVIDLGIGEPDLPAPESVKQAVASYALKGHKIYSDVRGTPELLEAITMYLKRDYGFNYLTSQVIGFDGGKVALDRVLETLVEVGDEVILPLPAWVSYEPQIVMAGGKVKYIPTSMENRFKITPDQLESAISEKTKAIIICSPSNPTGIVYTAEELKCLGEILEKYPNIFIISDDLYQHLHFENQFCNILMVCPKLKARTVIINGTTKSHSWRFGFLATENEDIIHHMAKIQSHRSGHPNLEAQAGAIKALEIGPMSERAKTFKDRHDDFFSKIKNVKGWKAIPADGAFYLFVDIASSMAQLHIKSDIEYAMELLKKQYVAVVPGFAFGCPSHLRISYCQTTPRLNQAIDRVMAYLKGEIL